MSLGRDVADEGRVMEEVGGSTRGLDGYLPSSCILFCNVYLARWLSWHFGCDCCLACGVSRFWCGEYGIVLREALDIGGMKWMEVRDCLVGRD
jgi:hypothetical protein